MFVFKQNRVFIFDFKQMAKTLFNNIKECFLLNIKKIVSLQEILNLGRKNECNRIR